MSEQVLDRRAFLLRAAALGLAASGLPSLLSACKSGGGGGNCLDTSGLTAEQLVTRNGTNYIEPSPDRTKSCANCQQYVAPTQEGGCGTCLIVPGPVAATGYCDNWTERTATG